MTDTVRVLVVDDDESLLQNLVFFFEDEGFDVFAALSGEEALMVLAENWVDVGIIDLRLPIMDGNELILAAHELRPAMKFLIHTGFVGPMLPASLAEIGITEEDIFHKPVMDMGLLSSRIYEILQKS